MLYPNITIILLDFMYILLVCIVYSCKNKIEEFKGFFLVT